METIKPGTRCECRDRTHQYDAARPYARHNVGTCPQRAVRLVTVRAESFARGIEGQPEHQHLAQVPMCEPCAAWAEKKGA
jgi:hypothetical protein